VLNFAKSLDFIRLFNFFFLENSIFIAMIYVAHRSLLLCMCFSIYLCLFLPSRSLGRRDLKQNDTKHNYNQNNDSKMMLRIMTT